MYHKRHEIHRRLSSVAAAAHSRYRRVREAGTQYASRQVVPKLRHVDQPLDRCHGYERVVPEVDGLPAQQLKSQLVYEVPKPERWRFGALCATSKHDMRRMLQ